MTQDRLSAFALAVFAGLGTDALRPPVFNGVFALFFQPKNTRDRNPDCAGGPTRGITEACAGPMPSSRFARRRNRACSLSGADSFYCNDPL
jgi:hypothetical protein